MLRSTRSRRIGFAVLLVVVVGAASGTAVAVTRGSGNHWRTAAVTRGSVRQTLAATGELLPLKSAEENFQVAGTVRRVDVSTGQHVKAGQLLATLQTGTLESAVHTAESSLQSSENKLASDESGESESGDSSDNSDTGTAEPGTGRSGALVGVIAAATPTAMPTAAPSPTGSTGSKGGHGGAPTSGGTSSNPLSAAQQAVVAAQHQTDGDLSLAQTALADEKRACATPTAASCLSAIQGVLADQTDVAAAEQVVATAEQSLDVLVDKAIAAAQQQLAKAAKLLKSVGNKAAGSKTSGDDSGRSKTDQGSSRSTSVATAADLATDQADIDTARASVDSAKSDLGQAKLRSPVAGRVSIVTVAKGDSVDGSAGTTPEIEIVTSKQDAVTVDVSDTQVRELHVGMAATVSPDGGGQLQGSVVSISPTGSSDSSVGSSGTVSYPVRIAVSGNHPGLVRGADAAVNVTLGSVSDVVVVPTSAVHRASTAWSVEVLRAGTEHKVTVKVGAIGANLTQITSGLTVGERVVLANLDAVVPSSNENTGVGGTGFGGGGARRFIGSFGGGFGGTGGGPVTFGR